MKIIIVITALITCLAVSNSSIASSKEKLILLDTVIYNKKVVLFYNADSAFITPLANTTTYPLYVSVDNSLDSIYYFLDTKPDNSRDIINSDSELYYPDWREPNFYTSLLQMDVIKKKQHYTSQALLVDSSLFIEITYGCKAYSLLQIQVNKSKHFILDKVLVSYYHFIIVPVDKVIGYIVSHGVHNGQTLLLKFDKKNYYTTNVYLNYPSYENTYLYYPSFENKPIKSFYHFYSKIKPTSLNKHPIKKFINKVGRHTFLGFN